MHSFHCYLSILFSLLFFNSHTYIQFQIGYFLFITTVLMHESLTKSLTEVPRILLLYEVIISLINLISINIPSNERIVPANK